MNALDQLEAIHFGHVDVCQYQAEGLTALDAAAQSPFPEFTWLGIADAAGRITAETGRDALGADASALPWFRQGRLGPYVTDRHAALQPQTASALR